MTTYIIHSFFRLFVIKVALIFFVIMLTINSTIGQTFLDTIRLGLPGSDISLIDIDVNPTTNLVYVSDFNNDVVFVINGNNNSVINKVDVTTPKDIAINHITNKVYVFSLVNTIAVIDGDINEVSDIIETESIFEFAIHSLTNRLYVLVSDRDIPGDSLMLVIDGDTNEIIDTIIGLTNPITQLVINTETNRLYGAPEFITYLPKFVTGERFDINSQTGVTVIDLDNNELIDIIQRNSGELAVNPVTNLVYITSPFFLYQHLAVILYYLV